MTTVLRDSENAHFRKWTQKMRDELPAEDFAGPDQSFPIENQEDLDAAVHSLGRAGGGDAARARIKARIKTIAKRKKLKLPDAWMSAAHGYNGIGEPDFDQLDLNVLGDVGNVETQYQLECAVYAANHFASDPETVKSKLRAVAAQRGLVYPETEDKAHAWGGPASGPFSTMHKDGGMYEESDLVLRTGLIFRAGEYPDKQLTVTPEDLEKTVAAFTTPVDTEIEHIYSEGIRTFLDGRTGQLRRIWAVGGDLHGDIVVPRWIDKQWSDFGRKVSVVIDKVTHQLKRVGMVLDPRVEEAAVMSAYASFAATRHDTPEGQHHIQAMHDQAAHAGAVCKSPEGTMGTASFVSNHEMAGIQKMHDVAVEHGASCDMRSGGMHTTGGFGANYTDQGGTGTPYLRQVHDLAEPSMPSGAPGAGITTRNDLPMARQVGRVGMSSPTPTSGGVKKFWNGIRAWGQMSAENRQMARESGAEMPDEGVFEIIEQEADTAARLAAQRAREEAQKVLNTELAQMRADRDDAIRLKEMAQREAAQAVSLRAQAEATGYIDGAIMSGKVYPAEREALIAAFSQAAVDDATGNQATFSVGGQGASRVTGFKAMIAARIPHGLTTEQLKSVPGGASILLNQTSSYEGDATPGEGRRMTDDPTQRAELLKMSKLMNGNGKTPAGGSTGRTGVN